MLTLANYEILSQIYESANSLVYRGLQKKDNTPVILKMLKQDYPTPAELTRYRQEYDITHQLDSVGVIKAYDIEKYHNTLVIILEDFGGESLKQFIAEGPFLVNTFLPLALQIVDSLAKIHAADIIHKDINPSNIIVNLDKHILKIIDFGISSRLPRENPTLKNPEELEGTLAYLSPEQTGRINRSIDYRSDLYSLGVTFYELLTGTLPFTSLDPLELVHCHLAKTPRPLYDIMPSIPSMLSDIVLKLLAKNAEDRYQSAFGLKADLDVCQLQLTKTEQIDFFPLAQNDFSGKLHIPQKLYGRERETEQLLHAFERVSQGASEMMLIAGYSGVGKTALVREVHKPMTSKRGYFAAGKFDQFQKNIPYSAMTQAFNEFCRYLLSESATTLANWQKKILAAVGNNGQVIIDVIPDLELVIGTQPPVVKVGPTETQNRFQMFFLNFVKALCDKKHPLILFIDDLQWVDSASLSLLKSIMLDDDIKYLFIIGAYRDNEVNNQHPLIRATNELANVNINRIQLGNLQQADVNQLLQESLLSQNLSTQTLTELIYQKTQGNAFFTHQFLQTLYEKELLHFDFEQHQWQWHLESIKAQNFTDNVVDLMANKINTLPLKTANTLQLAACMGNQFDLSTLAIIDQDSPNHILDVLRPALTESLIQPLDDHYKSFECFQKAQFKFLHDRVQQAAYSLIDEKQKKRVHLQIGRLLLKNTPPDTLEDSLFDIVGQFNQSLELITDLSERLKVASLNLKAAQKAKQATAYAAAFNYLSVARACLSENSWQQHYALTYTIYKETVEVHYLLSHFEESESLIQFMLTHIQSPTEKAEIYIFLILQYTLQTQYEKAIEVAREALKLLGIHLPKNEALHEASRHECEAAKQKLSSQSIASLAAQNKIPPTDIRAALLILSKLVPTGFLTNFDLLVWLGAKGTNLSLEHGWIVESAMLCIGYAFYPVKLFNDYQSGYEYCQLSLLVVDKFNNLAERCRILEASNDHFNFWVSPLKLTNDLANQAIQAGFESGEIQFASYTMLWQSCHTYYQGIPLPHFLEELHRFYQFVHKTKDQLTLEVFVGETFALGDLLGWEDKSWLPLSIDEMNEEQYVNDCVEKKAYLPLCLYYIFKLQIAYILNRYEQAHEFAQQAEKLLGYISLSISEVEHNFYSALTLTALYSQASKEEQEKYLQELAVKQKQMKIWFDHCPENFEHQYLLVEAEIARIKGDALAAMESYDQSIASAHENDFIQNEGIAHELAAQFWLDRNKEDIAEIYIRKAHYAYQQWGALLKVADLETRYPQCFVSKMTHFFPIGVHQTTTKMMSTSTQFGKWLDLISIMKSAQTLSGEIVLSRLLKKIMQIVIENAGAESGFLLLNQNDNWFVEASGQVDSHQVKVLQSLSLDQQPIAQTIIHYVERTLEHVVLNHATQESQFSNDAYIKKQHPKSILCLPLVNQGELTGILYLENNLTTGAFTPERLEVLKILSSQLAISIENALLYRTLEEKVDERTAQLAQANQAITVLNDQLKEDNLRMSAELDISRRLQQMLLPSQKEMQKIEHFDIAGFMAPADEVGGDYFDVLQEKKRLLFAIGDVTGHGLESGALTIMVQSSIRTLLALNETDPVKFFSALNQMVFHNIQRMGVGKSLTLALIDCIDDQLYLSGQHEDVIVVRQGNLELIDTVDLGFPIGLEEDISEFVNQITLSLNPGDVVVLFSDGITEAENEAKEYYGLERLSQIVQNNWQRSASEIQEAVIDDVRQFIGKQKVFDDMTVLVLKPV
jgi:predicted ATPase/serine phosphatase RsbU (regulator of sigma subunit)/tRNA A-37 threonylcarbamoyl transferase component Bud32